MPITQTANVTGALVEAFGIANEKRNEFLTPEHLVAGFLKDRDFWDAFCKCGRAEVLEAEIYQYINSLYKTPEDQELSIEFSAQLKEMFDIAGNAAASAMVNAVQTHHIIYAIFQLEDSYARFYLEQNLESSIPDFLNSLISLSDDEDGGVESGEKLARYLTPVLPREIVGMKDEADRLLRVLCRKTRSNVLVAGGRGVGKTALAGGISDRLEKGKVPDMLKDYLLMELNTTAILSGTQYRGDLEGRVHSIMESIADQENIILYIDELKSLGGTSKTDDGSKDILSLLVPYMKSGEVKFVISATHEDIKKLTATDNGVLSLFRQVDIEEPSDEDAAKIIKGILPELSEHHGVKYDKDVTAQAISLSRRYIQDRCLPDQAIDLLDEAGAYAQTRHEK